MPWQHESGILFRDIPDGQSEAYQCSQCGTFAGLHNIDGTCPILQQATGVRRPAQQRQPRPQTNPGELVTSRRFGVEIELIHLNTEAFKNDMGRYAIPYIPTQRSGSTTGTPTSWQLKHDGSVHGMGLELISPPLSGVKGLAEVKLVTELAKANGGRVDDSCGLHVHHSASDLTDAHLKNLLVLWYKYQDLAFGVANASRQNNRYCNKLSEQEFQSLHGMTRGFGAALRGMERYKGLNFASLNVHNTIEFRLLEGTLNVRKIEAWIALTQRIIRVARYSGSIDPSKVGAQFQLLGAVTKMLSRNGYQASEEESEAFNLLSSYYHKNMRANRPARRRTRRENLGE